MADRTTSRQPRTEDPVTEFGAGFNAGAAMSAMLKPDDGEALPPYAVVPEGWTVVDLEGFLDRPRRISADHVFKAPDSLSTYLGRFADENTMLAADYGRFRIEATLDGDEGGLSVQASHKTHRATYVAAMSATLVRWVQISGKPLTQVELAEFLEERAPDVIRPDAASVMEMVLNFEATKSVSFKSSTRLSNGSRQLVYVEDNDAKGGLTIPDRLTILAPVFEGMEPSPLDFLLRYRIDDGRLRFTLVFHNKEEVQRAAFARAIDQVLSALPPSLNDLPLYVVG